MVAVGGVIPTGNAVGAFNQSGGSDLILETMSHYRLLGRCIFSLYPRLKTVIITGTHCVSQCKEIALIIKPHVPLVLYH